MFPFVSPVSYLSGLYNPETMMHSGLYNPDCISFFWPVVYTTKKTLFKRFGRWSTSILTELMPFRPFLPSVPYKYASFSQKLLHLLLSPLPSTTMCYHRWPFIERGLFGNPSRVIWSVNMEGVSLGMRLVCLDVSLTIMVSCSLEAPVPALSPLAYPPRK